LRVDGKRGRDDRATDEDCSPDALKAGHWHLIP
jgi:hypothetical protein